MDIASLLAPEVDLHPDTDITNDALMPLWTTWLKTCGFKLTPAANNCRLTDAILEPEPSADNISQFLIHTPIHVKTVRRHTNGSCRCHVGTGKASRPIRSTELKHSMRLLVVFFRREKNNSLLTSPDFILFPTWLLHMFGYTRHANTLGRTDIRFLEDEMLAKEDHIYRLNHVLNTLFRFNLYDFDAVKLRMAVELANFLFNAAGLDNAWSEEGLEESYRQPQLYPTLLSLLRSPRPPKPKTICHNCTTKPASRRKLCVACYRYLLKHGESRPLRLIIASKHKFKSDWPSSLPARSSRHNMPPITHAVPAIEHPPAVRTRPHDYITNSKATAADVKKLCANCGIHNAHQWYRNPFGIGYWCETCESYYLRHNCAHPSEVLARTARRKTNVQAVDGCFTLYRPETTAAAVSSMVVEGQMISYPNTWRSFRSWRDGPCSNMIGNSHSALDEAASASSGPPSPLTPRPIQIAFYKPSAHFYETIDSFSG